MKICNSSKLILAIVSLAVTKNIISGGSKNTELETIRWTGENGQPMSVQAKYLGKGSFSKAYLELDSNMVYLVTEKKDSSKYFLAKLWQSNPYKHLPAIEYLGKKNTPYQKKNTFYWVTRMPFYDEIPEGDELCQTMEFLRNASRKWSLENYEKICMQVQNKYRFKMVNGQLWEINLPVDENSYELVSIQERLEKVSKLRKNLISYLKSNATNQPQIQGIINAMTLIDRYLDRSEVETPFDFDTILKGFRRENFRKDANGNVILIDPIFANNLSNCAKFIKEHVHPDAPEVNWDDFLDSIGF
jgi:hypothetical protein